MLVGSGVLVSPVTQWDGVLVGNGQPGPVTRALRAAIDKDMSSDAVKRIAIPTK